ncbi:MAG TPA: MarR family transcriptional regulator [Kofleriaceae bacterium]
MTRRAAPRAADEFVLHDAPGHLLRRCHQRSEELFTTLVGKDGPTRQQVALLVTAVQNPEASQAELVQRTGIDKNTLTQMINRLTARGLLERRQSKADARTNAIIATPAAVKLLETVLPKVREVQEQILAPLPVELRPVFQHCMRMIIGLDPK